MVVKGKLDAALRHKVMEIENEKQKQEAAEIAKSENMSKRQKEMHNRKKMEMIEANIKINKPKTPIEEEVTGIHEAYKLILSEHSRRAKKRDKQKLSPNNMMENLAISTPTIDVDKNKNAKKGKLFRRIAKTERAE